jgi:hypothetical protein
MNVSAKEIGRLIQNSEKAIYNLEKYIGIITKNSVNREHYGDKRIIDSIKLMYTVYESLQGMLFEEVRKIDRS